MQGEGGSNVFVWTHLSGCFRDWELMFSFSNWLLSSQLRKVYRHREPTLLFVNYKWKSWIRDKNLTVVPWICCGEKWNGSCSAMHKRWLCRRFVCKFHNAFFKYVVRLAQIRAWAPYGIDLGSTCALKEMEIYIIPLWVALVFEYSLKYLLFSVAKK